MRGAEHRPRCEVGMTLLTVTLGVPGSGKSTWVAANTGAALVVTADALRSNHRLHRGRLATDIETRAYRVLRTGRDVIADICAIHPAQRQGWLTLAARCHARTRLVVLGTPHAVSTARNSQRPDPVPPGVMRTYIAGHAAALTAIGHEPWHTIVRVPCEAP